jgi:hypothetical protein
LLCGIKHDSPTALKKVYPEIIESAVAARQLKRIERIEKGESGWQATAWPLDRQFAEALPRPETQITIIHQNNQQNNTVTAAAQPLSGQIVAPEREKGWGSTRSPFTTLIWHNASSGVRHPPTLAWAGLGWND